MTDALRRRLKQLFVALYRDNDNERNNAAGALYRFLRDNKVHPDEIDLIPGNLLERNRQAIEQLQTEIKQLQAENQRLLDQASHIDLRQEAEIGPLAEAGQRGGVDEKEPAKPKRKQPQQKRNQPKRKPTDNQIAILRGITANPGCTVRSLSFHVKGEPDTNENLADAISGMMKRKWLVREAINNRQQSKSWYRYWISDIGLQLLNEMSRDR